MADIADWYTESDPEDWEYDGPDDESGEPIGCCDECEGNLYEDDVYYLMGLQFCGQCYWYATGGEG